MQRRLITELVLRPGTRLGRRVQIPAAAFLSRDPHRARSSRVGVLKSLAAALGASLLLLACGSESGGGSDPVGAGDDAEGATDGVPAGPGDEPSSTAGPGTSQLPDTSARACDEPNPGPTPLRRLTNAEYRNTMNDLVGDAELVARATRSFPREPTSLGFRTSAQALTITPLVADEYLAAAQLLGPAAVARDGVVPCSVDAIEPSCVQGFVEDFGKRVYRRPLTRQELRRYSDLYDSVVGETGDVQMALDWIATTMFSSPHFLFRVELSEASGGEVSRPDDYEMATRLSYLLWQTMPDAELFAAADAGELSEPEGVEAQVRRMMGDPKALRVYEFFEQWLDLDEADGFSRNETAYPEFDEGTRSLLTAESRAFVYHLLTNRGTFAELLSADYTFANRALAEHYGLSQVPSGGAFERVPAPNRAGVLTQASLLIHDRPHRTSIVGRGLKVRTDFLCQIVPAPPADVDTTLPELDGSLTQRERLAEHRENSSCAGCHVLMDPIGEIFESYDALGRERSQDEAGAPVVAGGSIVGTRTLDGDYANARELGIAMGNSEEVRQCFVLQAFRFFYGRDAGAADSCTQQQLMASFARDDYQLVDLLMGLTRSDQFLYRLADGGQK